MGHVVNGHCAGDDRRTDVGEVDRVLAVGDGREDRAAGLHDLPAEPELLVMPGR